MNTLKLFLSRSVLIALFAWSLGPALAADKPMVALVFKSMANEFFQNMAAAAKAHQTQNANNYRLIVSGIPNETDTAGQIKLIEQAIAAKAKLLVLAPVETRPLIPVIKKALASGMLIINIDNKLDDRALSEAGLNIPFVGPSNRAGAKLVGDFLAQKLKSGDEVAIIEGISTATNAQSRTQGFRESMEQTNIKVVAVQSGLWETAKAKEVASALLTQYPNVRALLCGNDNMAIGAVQAVESGSKKGQILVVGYDNIPAIKAMLKDGRLAATADQFGDKQAVFGIEMGLKSLKDHVAQKDLQPMVQTPVTLISK